MKWRQEVFILFGSVKLSLEIVNVISAGNGTLRDLFRHFGRFEMTLRAT